MLAFNKRWHFASQQYPERERRLLAFADGMLPEDWPEDMRPSSHAPSNTRQDADQERDLRAIETEVQKTQSKIKNIQARRTKLGERFKPTDQTEQWDKSIETHAVLIDKLLATLNEWKSGKIPPLEYEKRIKTFYENAGVACNFTVSADNSVPTAQWSGMPQDKKLSKIHNIDAELIASLGTREPLATLETKNDELDAIADGYEPIIAELERIAKEEKIAADQAAERQKIAEKLRSRSEKIIAAHTDIQHTEKRLQSLSENRQIVYAQHPEVKDTIFEMEQWEQATYVNVAMMRMLTGSMLEWREGNMDPVSYVEKINDFLAKTSSGQQFTLSPASQIDTSAWVTLSNADREEIIKRVDTEIDRAIDIDGTLDTVDSMQVGISSMLQEYEGTLVKLSNPHEMTESNGRMGLITFINNHIEWMSINDMIAFSTDPFKKFWEARKKARERYRENKTNYYAEKIGDLTHWLPLGKQVQAELAAARESSNTKEKKEEVERLENSKAPFEQAKAELLQFVSSPNRFYGVVEYMAKKGWLYDYKPELNKIFGIDMPVPPGWNAANMSEYKVSLSVQDSGGQDHQKKDMTEIVGTHESIKPIVDSLEEELHKHNYWAAYTALDIAMKKGKIGESGTWICTTVMDHFRHDPDGFRYMPKELFDQMGNIGIVHPAWTSTMLKVDRHRLDNWRKTGQREKFQDAGNLADAISLIEEEIQEKLGVLDQKEVNAITAKVLAAQVYTDKKTGKHISIFSNRYNHHRKVILDSKTTTSPGKADDDFFGNISDAHLISADGVKAILIINSVGDFTENTRAQNYIENLLKLQDELLKAGLTEEYENMTRENRVKLNSYFAEDAKGTPAKIANWSVRKGRNGKLLVPEFVRRKLLDADIAQPFLKGSK